MTTKEVNLIADYINPRYHSFDNGGAVQFRDRGVRPSDHRGTPSR